MCSVRSPLVAVVVVAAAGLVARMSEGVVSNFLLTDERRSMWR